MSQLILATVYCVIALFLLTIGGNWACRILFNLAGMKDALAGLASTTTSADAGRYIGALERLVIAVGLVAHSWEAIAAVIALKTIARFKELDTQIPAEYFLVGSLFSLLWAVCVTLAWAICDATFGLHLAGSLIGFIGKA